MTYQLSANNGAFPIQSVTVTVRPKVAEQTHRPRRRARRYSRCRSPDQPALIPALNAYKSLFAQASGKSRKDCQGVLTARYQGKLQDLAAAWCDAAKRFDANDQGCQTGRISRSPDFELRRDFDCLSQRTATRSRSGLKRHSTSQRARTGPGKSLGGNEATTYSRVSRPTSLSLRSIEPMNSGPGDRPAVAPVPPSL